MYIKKNTISELLFFQAFKNNKERKEIDEKIIKLAKESRDTAINDGHYTRASFASNAIVAFYESCIEGADSFYGVAKSSYNAHISYGIHDDVLFENYTGNNAIYDDTCNKEIKRQIDIIKKVYLGKL